MYNRPNQFCQIKTFKYNGIFSGFQMIECQQFFNHIVHLRRLIHNDLTIEITAFCIVIDTFFQSFCISLDQCDRRFQLMRDIGKKFFSHLVDLDLFFDIILQLIIRCFQLRNRPFQRL